MKKYLIFIFASFLISLAFSGIVFAESTSTPFQIVKCGNTGQDPCNFDDFIAFVNDIIDMVGKGIAVIATITLVVIGSRILLNPESTSERENAKEMFRKTVYGIFFFLCGYLIVDLIIKGLGGESGKLLEWFK